MANTTPTLTDLLNSTENNGEMNESVRKQIEQALAKTKNTTDKPKRGSRSSKKSSKATASLSELFSSPEYSGEMNESVRKQIEQALAKQAKKKKLPTKQKIDLGDSVVVVDKNENVSTVVPPEAKPQGNVSAETKAQERQSFKGMAKAGVLGLGSAAFNKMFPTLGKGLDALKSRLEKQEKNTADNNTANKSYSRQVERSSVFLNTMSENLNKTNDILQQILVVVNRNATNQVPAAAGGLGGIPNIDLPDRNRGGSQQRRTQTVPDTSPRAKPRMSLGRAGMFGGIAAGVAGLGAWAYSAFSGRGGDNAQPEPPQAAQPVPQDAPPASKPTPQATPSVSQSPPAAAPGTEYDITTGAPIGAPAARVQTPPQAAAPVATPTPATTELTPRQRGMVDRFLRSKQLQGDQTARELAEYIVTRIRQTDSLSIDEQNLDSNYTRIRIRQSPIRMLIDNQPVIPGQIFTSGQMRAIGDGIMMNGRQHYPAVVLEQYDRQKNENATPQQAPATPETTTPNNNTSDGSGSGEETGGSGGDATPVQSEAVTPTQNVTSAPVQPAATPAAAPGTEYDITTGMQIGAPAATPVVTPNATPVAAPSPSATTEQSSNELTDQQKQFVDYFLRYNELQDNEEARSIAEYIVKRRNMPGSLPNIASRDLRSLVFNELRRRADRMGGMLIDNKLVLPGRPLTAAQMSSIERAGVQHYPQYVIDQYNRQKNGNDTPVPTSTTATDGAAIAQSSTNETASNTQPSPALASRPGIRMGREIGESSRVAAPPPTATTPAAPPPVPVTQQTATPEASGSVNPMTDPSGFNARILNVRAQEILFKADKFEYSEGFQLATGSPTPTPGPTPGPAAGGEGAPTAGGSTPGPAPAAAGGSTSGATSAAPAAGAPGVNQIGTANISGLDFAAGVDQRINPGIADKTKEIQSAFGKKLTVTSGFRDPARNARVGGAGGSKHLTADAVDVQFPGNQQETIDLIKVASEKGAGGIGVYRPGFLHIDTGAKRVWGPDYKATSIPDWAKPALDEHMGKPASKAGGGAAAGGGETASPMPGGQQQAAAPAASPSAPAATPEPSMPSSGAAMSSASVADETASRPTAGPTPPPPDTTAPITAAPQGPSLPGIDPNNPGPVEPADAGIRYSRLFNIAA